jgi:hypothetical protein
MHHQVLEQQTDDKVAVAMAQVAKDRFANLAGCSFGKAYYSPDNKKQLQIYWITLFYPKRADYQQKTKKIEQSEEFVTSRRKHSAVESSIKALENHRLKH